MTFEEILDQAIAMLQRRGRLTYGTLKRQFQLDDAVLDDLKEQLLYAHPQVVDDAGRGLVWTGETDRSPTTTPLTPQLVPPGPLRAPQAVQPSQTATPRRELGRLVEAELIYQRGLPPGATYTFKHALIQDTAYESL
jgi:hypothetical protein